MSRLNRRRRTAEVFFHSKAQIVVAVVVVVVVVVVIVVIVVIVVVAVVVVVVAVVAVVVVAAVACTYLFHTSHFEQCVLAFCVDCRSATTALFSLVFQSPKKLTTN